MADRTELERCRDGRAGTSGLAPDLAVSELDFNGLQVLPNAGAKYTFAGAGLE